MNGHPKHPDSHQENALEINDISFSFGQNEVLSHISLNVSNGDYLGIIGPNGAGKTTLLKIILGLLKPSAGEIRLFGQNVRAFKEWQKIGYVPQNVSSFDKNFPATVNEIVMMGRYAAKGLLRGTNQNDQKIVDEALSEVEMLEYKNRLIGNLSEGQQQRVFIAKALAGKPKILFLDEPTAGVDPGAQRDFYNLLKYLNEKKLLTLVLISHDVDALTRETKHIACVDRSLVCHGTAQEFLKDTRLAELYGREVKIIAHHHAH